MDGGYHGKLLRVDLTRNEISTEELSQTWYRKYVGGRGFIIYHLLKELAPGIDPFGAENKVIFACGPVTGLPIAGAGRYAVGAKSPLTGGFGEAESGGFFGSELKQAGFDTVIIEGCSEEPVYLWIHDGEAEIRDASRLWGLDIAESEEAIRSELGDKRIRTAQIGIGGENLVRYAAIMNDIAHGASRTGLGAVMGSKNLKALAVRGTTRVQAADMDSIAKYAKLIRQDPSKTEGLTKFGTAASTYGHGQTGNLPVRNFRDGYFEGVKSIDAKSFIDHYRTGTNSCHACFVRCDPVAAGETRWGSINPQYGGPEYETIGALGSCCGVDDMGAIVKGNELCNKYGIDTISCGVTIAFAMECFEEGIITSEDTGGIDLRFGNADAMVQMIEMIAHREGIGDVLAEGSKRAAQSIGKGAKKFAMQVKGSEIPMQEPRYKQGFGLGMAINPAGPDHTIAVHDTLLTTLEGVQTYAGLNVHTPMPSTELGPRKVAAMYHIGLARHFGNNLVMCNFVPHGIDGYREILNAATGWNMTVYEMLKSGERNLTLAHIFNLKQGLTEEDNALPQRFHTSQRGGPLEGIIVDPQDFVASKRLIYEMLGWDPVTSIPTRSRLVELGIEWAAQEIEG